MALQFEDVLHAICSEVTATHANDYQRVFLLGDAKEAKIAFDILVSYGFDAKVYHEAGKPSKLYITHPNLTPAQLEHTLSAALAYATTLKTLKHGLDQLSTSNVASLYSPDYTVTFVNTPPNGKQIVINVTPRAAVTKAPNAAMSSTPRPTAAAAQPVAVAKSSAILEQKAAAKAARAKAQAEQDEFKSGPAVGKSYMGIKGLESTDEESLRKRALLYLSGNIATSSFSFLIMVVIIAILFTFFVFSKAFLCPDFAVAKKNKSWYCSYDEDEKKDNKNQQQPGQPNAPGGANPQPQ